MSAYQLIDSRLHNGIWQAVVSGGQGSHKPSLAAKHHQTTLTGLSVKQADQDSQWIVTLPIPADILSDGVQTIVLEDTRTGDIIDSFALIAGQSTSFDIRAEVDLLRNEVDLLKTVIRQSLGV